MVRENFDVWREIVADSERLQKTSLRELFSSDTARAKTMTKTVGDDEFEIVVDFSKQLIDKECLNNLLILAKQAKVLEKFAEMRRGIKVNSTENLPALHTALRVAATSMVKVDGEDVVAQVHDELAKIKSFVEKVRSEKKFKKIINIGIGGSDLGPALIYEALRKGATPTIECIFVANIDASEINLALAKCNPRETLFVVCSKSFNTAETLANARVAADWLARALGVKIDSHEVAIQFVVVSANTKRAVEVGVVAANSFQIWPWVGGRYSISSAMSLAPIIAFGFEMFEEFLAGMYSVDDLMQNAAPEDNATLILGLIDVLNFGTQRFASQAILPYTSTLRLLPSYLQQLIMESNGKSVQSDGSAVQVSSSPVVWGGVGTNSQHAFMQMLHQGMQTVPVDFIGFAQISDGQADSNDALIANMLAQASALAFGLANDEITSSASDKIELIAHKMMPGNRPSTVLLAKTLDARTLGALIAIYEHRVFVHGVISRINSFDQWGVELGKVLSLEILQKLRNSNDVEVADKRNFDDSSTKNLIDWYRQSRKAD